MVDFLVIGPFGAVIYSNMFPLIKDDIVRLGSSRVGEFTDGTFCNSIWFSTISDYCPPELELKKQYNEDDYHKFDNYDAINVDRTEDIPSDYNGVMGVPVTFLEKWNKDQFDVVGISNLGSTKYDFVRPYVDGLCKYPRLLIKRKSYEK